MARKNVIQFSVEVIDRASKKLDGIAGQLIRFAKRAAFAAAGMATAFAFAAKKAINAADQIAKTARVVGLSAESLQEFRFAAQQMGIANIGLDDSMRRMQRRMGEFINSGAGPAKLALEGLGLEITDTAGKFVGTEEAFFRSVDAISKLGSVAEQSAVAAQLFGDDFGPKLVPLFEKGRKGVEEFMQEARDLGIVMSNEAAAGAEKAQDAFGRLSSVLSSKVIQAFAENSAAIETTITLLIELVSRIFDTIAAFAMFTGLADKGVQELEKGIAGLVAQQADLINQYGDDAMEGTLYKALQAQIEIDIAKIRELNKLTELSKRSAEGGTGGGFSFARPAGANPLEGFVRSFDTTTQQVHAKIEMLRKAIAEGLIPSKAEQARIQAAILSALDAERIELTFDEIEAASTESFDFMAAAAEQAAQSMQSSLADFFFDPVENGLQGLLKSFIQVIRRMISEVLAFQTLEFFGLGDVFKKISGRAGGGGVESGRPYIVGERGPELFVPNQSGRVVPNSALGGQSGGMPQFVTNIDARGADPGLIARLPRILEDRDRRLLLMMQRYSETGVLPI